jgi:hypothetical protein
LFLCGNMIGPAGATSLARAARACPALTGLFLIGNELGEDGSTALREAARERHGFELVL